MLVIGEAIVQERSAQQEMVRTRSFGLGEEAINAEVSGKIQRPILNKSLDFNTSGLIFFLIPLPFVVLFQEIAVTDPTHFSGHLPAVGQQLPVLGLQTASEIFPRGQRAST